MGIRDRGVGDEGGGGNGGTVGSREAALRAAWARGPPLLRFFFSEAWADAQRWHAARVEFAASAAAGAVCGWALALGGRSASNVRLCARSGRLVHCGLGERAPGDAGARAEAVPFRLTRETVHCLGVAGIDGGGRAGFRAAAEATAVALRAGGARGALLSAMAVLQHDPLLEWALGAADNGAAGAAAVARARERVDGVEGSEPLSAGGQVARLIAEAIDPARLAEMEHGWGAWL